MNNVVLVALDTFRDRNLDSSDSPFLSGRKKFDSKHYSNSPWTAPAHATLFSGNMPSEHGATTEESFFKGENEVEKAFCDEGFRTVGLSENGIVSEDLGFGGSFDLFESAGENVIGARAWNEVWEKDSKYDGRVEKYSDFLKKVVEYRDLRSLGTPLMRLRRKILDNEDYNPTGSRQTLRRALNFLEGDEKTFLFLNLMPVHAPYTFNEKQRQEYLPGLSEEEIEEITNFHNLLSYLESGIDRPDLFEKREKAYRASISYTDELLEWFYEEAPEDTLFVVLGDHGELIGEYEKGGVSLIDHHFGTFKELLEVPLIIFSKGEGPGIDVGEGLSDHTELHEMLKDLAKGETAEIGKKEMVFAEYYGKAGFNRQFGIDIPEKYRNLFERKSFSIITEDYKFDMASDGEFLWDRIGDTEQEQLDLGMLPSEIEQKADILYRWRIE